MGKKAFWGHGDNWKEVYVERLASVDKAGIMYSRVPGTPPVLELGDDNIGLDSRKINLGTTCNIDLGARENRAK